MATIDGDSAALTVAQPCQRQLAPSFLPTAAVLELTYQCNHACTFCSCPWFSGRHDYEIHPELSAADWKRVIDELCARGVQDLAFTGGEPLLKAQWEELVTHAASCRCQRVRMVSGKLTREICSPRLSLLTNGRSMSDQTLALCREHGVRLSMSLPGLATFAEHTGGGDAQNVLAWFGKARALGIPATVGVTVTRRNIDELYETIATALCAGADTLLLNRFLPGGRGLAYEAELALDASGVRRMLDIAEDVLRTAKRYGNVGTELPLCLIDPSRYKHLRIASRCSAATSFFAVDPSGFVRVCNHSRVRLHHVDDIDNLKTHDYWRAFALRQHSPQACVACAARPACDGGCREAAHIVTGRLDGEDSLLRWRSMTGPCTTI